MLQKFDERNRHLIVNVSGELVHRDQARISPFDSSVQGGDAVWEGLRLYRGRIFRLEQHLERLMRSARALAFAQIPSREAIAHEIRRTLAANGMFDGVHIRLTLTRGVKVTSGMDPRLNTQGPTLIVLAEHKAPVYGRSGLWLITSSVRRSAPAPWVSWRRSRGSTAGRSATANPDRRRNGCRSCSANSPLARERSWRRPPRRPGDPRRAGRSQLVVDSLR